MGFEVTDVFVTLKPREHWKRAKTQEELVAAMAEVTENLPGMRAVYSQPIEMRINEMVAGIRADLGHQALRRRPGRAQGQGRRDRAGGQGQSPARPTSRPSRSPACRCSGSRSTGTPCPATASPARQVLDAVKPRRAASTSARSWSPAAGSRWSSGCRCRTATTRSALEKILIPTASGQRLPLTRLARLEETTGPVHDPARVGPAADRRPGQRPGPRHRLVRQGGPGADRPRGDAELPSGYTIEWGGQFENMQRAERRLLIVVPLALALILSLLYLTFHSVRDAADDLQRRAVRPRRRRARAVGHGPAVHHLGGRRLRGPGRGVDARRAWCWSAPSATGWPTACRSARRSSRPGSPGSGRC